MTPTGGLPAEMRRESQAKHRAELAEQAKLDDLDREICHCPKPLKDGVYLGAWRCKLCGWLIR